MFDYVEFPPAESGGRVGLHGYGHYREEYARSRAGGGGTTAGFESGGVSCRVPLGDAFGPHCFPVFR